MGAVGVSFLAPPLGRYLPPLPCPPPPAGRALPLTGAMAEQPEEGAPAPPAPAPPAPPAALPLSAPPGGSQRLLFSHDLVSGRYRGSVRFGLVRLIHGEDSEEDSEEGGRGTAAGGAASSGGSESGGPGAGGGEEGRASPLRRGYVRVQWYPEGIKQHVKETKVTGAGGDPRPARARVPPRGSGAGCGTEAPPWRPLGAGPLRPAGSGALEAPEQEVAAPFPPGCPSLPARAASSRSGEGGRCSPECEIPSPPFTTLPQAAQHGCCCLPCAYGRARLLCCGDGACWRKEKRAYEGDLSELPDISYLLEL